MARSKKSGTEAEASTLGARLATLLRAKLPGVVQKPARVGKAHEALPPALADVHRHVGPGTVLGPYGAELMTPAASARQQAEWNRERAELDPNYLTSWYPFLDDRTAAILCIETVKGDARAPIVYHEHDDPGDTRELAPSLEAYLEVVERVLADLPDGEAGNARNEEEQIERFTVALLAALEPTTASRM